MAFAKLFGNDDNQVLVKLDTSEDGGPEVRFFVKPDGLGVCSQAAEYEDSDEGWDKAEAFFAGIDEKRALEAGEQLKALLAEMMSEA